MRLTAFGQKYIPDSTNLSMSPSTTSHTHKMALRFWLPFLFTLPSITLPSITASTRVVSSGDTHPPCRYIPGDAGWPTQSDWDRLNTTINGRLVQTIPVAHVCHQSGVFSEYNQTACRDLGIAFQDAGAETMYVISYLVPSPRTLGLPFFFFSLLFHITIPYSFSYISWESRNPVS